MKSHEKNPVGWFEIPVTDMERAIKFYEAIFQISLERHEMGPLDMAWFPEVKDGRGSSGSLVFHKDFYKPSTDGVLIYFTSPTGDIDQDMERVEKAGGKILIPKKHISAEYGSMGVFLDSEGNRIALHARS